MEYEDYAPGQQEVTKRSYGSLVHQLPKGSK